jgi:nitrogen fixation/metabolism regulation signal transduction histidine kinase
MADEVERNKSIRMSLEKIASWQTIARKMAHEIKNPLTPIGLMVARLQKQYRGDDENYRKLLHDAHTIVGDEIRSLGRMVDNFSKFAQLPQANLMPADMVETAKQAWKLECERYASILFQPSVEQLTVEHDRAQIIQVLHNLIKNAAQASAATTITISIRKADAECVVEVIDNGPGIPQDIQTKIFDAYFTTKNTGPDPGMGLGLAICQKVAIEHKGKLIFESKLGHTVFRLILPLKQGSNS